MNGLDIINLIVIGFFLIKGLIKGLAKELVSIFGLLAAFLLAIGYYPFISDLLSPYIENQSFRNITAFAGFFVLSYLLVGIVGMGLNKVMNMSLTKSANIFFGGIVGGLKGILLASVLILIVSVFVQEDDPLLKGSATRPFLAVTGQMIQNLLPEELGKYMKPGPASLPSLDKIKLPDLKKIKEKLPFKKSNED